MTHPDSLAPLGVRSAAIAGTCGRGASRLRSAVCFALASIGAVTAHAADAPADRAVLEEVIVTATKRAENVQDIPLSVKALTGEELERRGATSLEQALVGEPNVLIVDGGNAIGRNVAIRGVSDGLAGLTQSTVAIYVDDMPTTVAQTSGNVSLALYDIENVTIIRGPRSTLYGSAALGGTIKIETRTPSLERFEGNAGINVWKTDSAGDLSTDVHATVSVPLKEGAFALGLTGYRNEQAGFIDSLNLGEDINGTTTTGGRLTLYARPADALTVALKLYYQDTDGDSSSLIDPGSRGLRAPDGLAVAQAWGDTLKAATLTVKYSTAAFDFVSATSHFDKKAPYVSDLTAFFGPLLGFPPSVTLASRGSFDSVVTSQEFRIVSAAADAGWNWSAGLFWSDEDTDNNATTPSPIGELFGSLTNFKNEQKAVFAELGYKWASGWGATAGMRYTDYTSRAKINLLGLFAIPIPVDVNFDEAPVTPHVALSYTTGDQMYYVQASRGFRLGKGNFPVIPVPGFDVPPFASSDRLWTYEVGAKTEWLDRRMTLNAAVYYTDWDNPQLTLLLPTGFSYINSVGALNPGAGIEVKGVEIDLAARPVPDLTLSAGIGYADSTFTKDVQGLDPLGGITRAGSRTAAIPEITANASIRYEFPLGTLRGNVGATVQYVGDYASGYGALARDIGDYTTADLRAGIDFETWSLSAFVTNVGNERPELTRTGLGPITYGATLRPRSFGLGANFRF